MILAHTIKGYGLGEGGEGMNKTHQVKKVEEPFLILEFRNRFALPLTPDEDVAHAAISAQVAGRRQPRDEVHARAP